MALPWVEMKKEEEYGIKTNVVPWDEVSQQNIQSNASQPYPILKSAPIQEEEEDTMLKRISRLILPRSLEIKLGITKPNDWDIMMQNEDGRMSYIREKQFTELYKKEIKESPVVPKEYKEPTGFFGQFLEGIQTGYISSIKGGFGYFVESMGRIASNPERLQWGAKLGDMATIELIKRPELLEPEDLKPFFEGGLIDRRWWGRRIGETLPFIGSTIAFATLGGLVGGPGGAVAGGLSSSATIEKGNSYKRYVDSGVPPDKADIYSTVYGLIAGTIENTLGVSPAKIGTKIATKGFERAVYNNYKEYLIKEIPKVGIETIKNSLTEGGEEVAQGIAENLILKFYRTETPVFTKDLLEEFASGFAASFPWGATNIRIPDIKKKNSAEIKTIEQSIKKADEVLQKQVVPTEKVITPKGLEPLARKYGLTIEESSTLVKKFPENKYKLNLLEEIGGREELTKIEQDSFVWTPPTIGYNNPYTNVMKNAWNKIGKIWDSKAPLILKEAQTKEISQLLKERQRVYDGLSRKYYEDIINPLIKLSTKEKQKIGEMIFKRIDIPNEYERLIKDIDIKIGQLGQSIVNIDKELVKAGKLDKSMALLTEETWLSNLGEYSKTLYRKIKDGKSQIIPKSTITSEGVIDRSSFKRKLTDEEWGANSLMFEGKTKEEIETYTLEELKELGVSAKEKYGWVFQADYILARTFKDLSRAYATRLFQKEIVENPRLFTNNVKEATERGFIPVRDILPKGTEKDIRLGPINGGYINKGLQEELKMFLMGNNQDKINAIFQEPLSWWKAFRVAGNPPTVIRNFISGSTIQTDLAGYPVWTPKNSVRYIRAVKSYLSKDSLYEKLRDGGQYGSDYFSVEIEADEMSRIISRAEKSNNAMNTITEDIVAIISEKSKDAKEIFNYYGIIDHMQRTYLASCALDDGATLPQAVHFANKWELDYRFVPLFVGSLRSGIAGWLYPFLSFYILMAPRIAEVLVTRPWVLVKYPIIIAMANTIAASMLGMDDDDIDNAKPEFLEENSYVVVMPTRDSNGDLRFLNLDYVFPFGGPSTLFIDWNQVLTMVKNPGMMGIVINILNNYDNFTEKKIYNETDLDEEKKKKISNYVVRNLGPGFVTHALNIWDASQGEIIGFPIKKERDMIQTIARSLGISVYSGGFNESFFKIKNLQEEINNIRWAMTTMMQDPKISTEEKQKNATLFQEEIRLRAEKIRDIGDSISSQAQIEQKNKVIPWDEFTE